MKIAAEISTACFIEIKTPGTPLVTERPYRPGCFAPSGILAGAVAQVQNTVYLSTRASTPIQPLGTAGDILDSIYRYSPRAFLIVGRLASFENDAGEVQQHRLRSFELFRSSTLMPEIITFDELYHRALAIVSHEVDSTPVDQ